MGKKRGGAGLGGAVPVVRGGGVPVLGPAGGGRRFAVCRGDDVFIPNGDFIILPGDILHITGSHHDLGKIVKELIAKKSTNVKSVMLIGGSRISIYLCNMLTASGKDVVVIEKNKNN